MKIVKKRLSDLRSPGYNPRVSAGDVKNFYKKLDDSINKFGYIQPIIWNKRTNNIVGGNQRLHILRNNNKDSFEIDVVEVDLSLEDEKALNITLNKVSSNWDMPKLNILMKELEEINYDTKITGFDLKEINELFDQFVEPKDEIFNLDDALLRENRYSVQRGDMFQLGSHVLMCGDCTNVGDIKRLVGKNRMDMVFTDPPYNALKSWNKDEAKSETRLNPNKWFINDNMDWDKYILFINNSFKNLKGHSVYICCDYRIYPLIINAIKISQYDLKHCIVWKKNVWGLGKRYRFQHEFIAYACKDKAPFYGDRSQSDVWELNTDRTTKHNTPKPIGLTVKALHNSSIHNNNILDLFGGSGSTLIACEQTKRNCYMMEIDPHYCSVIIERWENYTKKIHENI